MKSTLIVLAAAGGLIAAGSAPAAAPEEAFKAGGCATCHAPDTKKMGPSVKDLTAKHKGDKAQVDKIAAKIVDGKGHPKGKASADDTKAAVGFAIGAK